MSSFTVRSRSYTRRAVLNNHLIIGSPRTPSYSPVQQSSEFLDDQFMSLWKIMSNDERISCFSKLASEKKQTLLKSLYPEAFGGVGTIQNISGPAYAGNANKKRKIESSVLPKSLPQPSSSVSSTESSSVNDSNYDCCDLIYCDEMSRHLGNFLAHVIPRSFSDLDLESRYVNLIPLLDWEEATKYMLENVPKHEIHDTCPLWIVHLFDKWISSSPCDRYPDGHFQEFKHLSNQVPIYRQHMKFCDFIEIMHSPGYGSIWAELFGRLFVTRQFKVPASDIYEPQRYVDRLDFQGVLDFFNLLAVNHGFALVARMDETHKFIKTMVEAFVRKVKQRQSGRFHGGEQNGGVMEGAGDGNLDRGEATGGEGVADCEGFAGGKKQKGVGDSVGGGAYSARSRRNRRSLFTRLDAEVNPGSSAETHKSVGFGEIGGGENEVWDLTGSGGETLEDGEGELGDDEQGEENCREVRWIEIDSESSESEEV